MESRKSAKTIIIDVGTGDGQSLDCMNLRSAEFSRLMTNRARYERLCGRLSVSTTPTGTEHIRPSVMSLKLRKISVVVANCTLGNVLDDPELQTALVQSEVRAIVCTS